MAECMEYKLSMFNNLIDREAETLLFNSRTRTSVKLDGAEKNMYFLAMNVINKDALIKLHSFNLVAVRSSSNKFTGSNIKKQIGNIGPDTSDRLFNCISSFSIPELELSINNKCNLQCRECGFLTPNQPKLR